MGGSDGDNRGNELKRVAAFICLLVVGSADRFSGQLSVVS